MTSEARQIIKNLGRDRVKVIAKMTETMSEKGLITTEFGTINVKDFRDWKDVLEEK